MSDHGRLYGEIPLGYYRVRRAIERLDGFPPELEQALLHIILSHHGSLEHGSPVVPCTREATLVHMIDNLGGRLGSFDRLEKELAGRRAVVGLRQGRSAAGAYFAGPRRRPPRPRRRAVPRRSVADSRRPAPNLRKLRPRARSRRRTAPTTVDVKGMAKDTEKLIRQLSLISYLMAERRPVTAPEIRRDVEGYSVMNEDAFARRFYADRSELEALGIVLSVEKPVDGLVEQENYSLPPENFHLPPIEFTDEELAALAHRAAAARRRVRLRRAAAAGAAADLLGPPEPAELARAAHGRARDHRLGRRPRGLAAAGQDRDRDLPPQDDRVRLLHDGARRDWARAGSTPTSCSTRAASSTSSGARTSATRSASSACRGSAARSATRPRPSTTSSAPPTSTRALRQPDRLAVRRSDRHRRDLDRRPRIAWQIERHFGRYGEMRPPGDDGDRVFVTAVRQRPPADRLGARPRRARADRSARPSSPPSCASGVELLIERHSGEPQAPMTAGEPGSSPTGEPERARLRRRGNGHHPEAAIRPERFARLVTLASILIDAGRAGRRLDAARRPRVAQDLRAGAARGHLGAERRQLRRRHLRALRRDRRRRA